FVPVAGLNWMTKTMTIAMTAAAPRMLVILFPTTQRHAAASAVLRLQPQNRFQIGRQLFPGGRHSTALGDRERGLPCSASAPRPTFGQGFALSAATQRSRGTSIGFDGASPQTPRRRASPSAARRGSYQLARLLTGGTR